MAKEIVIPSEFLAWIPEFKCISIVVRQEVGSQCILNIPQGKLCLILCVLKAARSAYLEALSAEKDLD